MLVALGKPKGEFKDYSDAIKNQNAFEIFDLANPENKISSPPAVFPNMIISATGGLLGDQPIICGG